MVDPFVGQGTTALAAVSERRRFLGSDIDAGCVSLARERLVVEGVEQGSANDDAEPA